MKIKALLVDDEQDSIEVLQILLATHCPHIEVISSANTVNEAIIQIKKHNPHLVFLDVEMPGKNGFELLNAISDKKFHVIMVTGYEHYALKALRYSALDYILKPVSSEHLLSAVAKLDPTKMKSDPRLAHFNELLLQDTATFDKLMISSSSGFRNIALTNILYIEASSGSYSIFHLSNGKEIVSKPLKHFEDILPETLFYRTHRSHLVNITTIKKYDRTSGLITLSNKEELPVSVRKRGNLYKLVSSFNTKNNA